MHALLLSTLDLTEGVHKSAQAHFGEGGFNAASSLRKIRQWLRGGQGSSPVSMCDETTGDGDGVWIGCGPGLGGMTGSDEIWLGAYKWSSGKWGQMTWMDGME